MLKVSLIIPTYNRRDYILAVLETIKEQDCEQDIFEVIVADNGSNDGTREALSALSCNFPLKVITINKESRFEAARLRNQAVKSAKGDILIFVDSDILLPKSFIRNHLCYYSSPEDLISVIGTVYYLENKTYKQSVDYILQEESLAVDPLERFYSSSTECGIWNPLAWMLYHAGNVSLTKKAFQLSGGFDEWHREWSIEDLDFGFQLQKNGVRIVYSKYAYGMHKWHESSGKNSQSINTGFAYLISKENGNPLVQYAFNDLQHLQYEIDKHIVRTSIGKRKSYIAALKLSNPEYQIPDFTIAIYSLGHHDTLYSLLVALEAQNNGHFEVLIVDDSDCIEKDATLQTMDYSYPLRLFHVNWFKEKANYLTSTITYRHLAVNQTNSFMEKMLMQSLERSDRWYEEILKEQFETFVYDQAIGTYVKFIHDQESIGTTFISNLYRDLLNNTEREIHNED